MSSDDQAFVENSQRSLSSRVVLEVAAELDADPLELDPLYERVDPEALNALFRTSRPSRPDDRVELTIEGCDVTVYGTGRIEVSARTANARR